MKKIRDNYCNYLKYIILLVSFIITFIYLLCNQFGLRLYGDAYGYNIMAEAFVEHGLGNFHLQLEAGTDAQYLFSVRGYAWPLILAIFKILGFRTNIGYTFWWSLFLASGLTFFLPELIGCVCRKEVGVIGRVVVLILTMILFPGLLMYPLSDMPAFLLIILCLYLYYKVKEKSMFKKSVWACIIGCILGIAYYTRQGSVVSIIGFMLLMFIFSDKVRIRRMILSSLLLGGIILSAIPQVIINVECNGKMTYEVPIAFTTGITDLEYRSGMKDIRYETNISGKYPNIVVLAEDNLADALFQQEGILLETVGPKEMLKIASKYPIEVLGIFAAKFANNIDPRYGEIYITDLHSNRYFIIILNFTLWFLGIMGVFYQINHFKQNEVLGMKKELLFIFEKREIVIAYTIIAIPAIFHLAGTHVEARYFYPAYAVLWSFLSMLYPWNSLLMYMKEHIFSILIIYIALFGCVSSMWNFTREKIPYFSYFYQQEPVVWTGDTYLDLTSMDQAGVIGATHQFNYNAEEQKLTMLGSFELQDAWDKDVKYKLIFSSEEAQYVYKISNYNGLYISINMYLFDLPVGDYHIYYLLEQLDSQKLYDTLYDIHK